jgi:hypothetical protein
MNRDPFQDTGGDGLRAVPIFGYTVIMLIRQFHRESFDSMAAKEQAPHAVPMQIGLSLRRMGG